MQQKCPPGVSTIFCQALTGNCKCIPQKEIRATLTQIPKDYHPDNLKQWLDYVGDELFRMQRK